MTILRTLVTIAVAAPFVALAGCDSAGGDSAGQELSNLEVAVAIANGVAVEPGGALEAVAGAIDDGESSQGRGCTAERSYDETTQTWTAVVECERGFPDSRFWARFGRTRTFRFLDAAGVPQQSPEGAASLEFAIVDGHGEVHTPWLHHVLLDIGADINVDDLQEELVTVNGTYDRAATDTLFVRRFGQAAVRRTLIYDLDLEFLDVRGPRHRPGDWGRPVSGTIEGHVVGAATFTRRDGTTVTREFDRSFTIVFDNPAAETATIRVGSEQFEADLLTGAVVGAE